ncbi:MAG: hypothetical protein R3B41_02255 [Candidatus Doudnabacteria bacterium]
MQIQDEQQIKEINHRLEIISGRMGNVWLSFVKGMLTGFGYVLGAGLAIILIGWFLNVIGVISPLTETANEWKEIFQNSQNQTFIPATKDEVQN